MHTIVTTRFGAVRGSVVEGVHAFKGIPYAAPPFGANRLLPPQPVEPWSGVRDALFFGPKSPQLPYPPPVDHRVTIRFDIASKVADDPRYAERHNGMACASFCCHWGREAEAITTAKRWQ